jgi:hypothetical protein
VDAFLTRQAHGSAEVYTSERGKSCLSDARLGDADEARENLPEKVLVFDFTSLSPDFPLTSLVPYSMSNSCSSYSVYLAAEKSAEDVIN